MHDFLNGLFGFEREHHLLFTLYADAADTLLVRARRIVPVYMHINKGFFDMSFYVLYYIM